MYHFVRVAEKIMNRLIVGVIGWLFVMAMSAGADEDWYPSKYGEGDTLGAINNLSPAGVVKATQLVKTGKTYPLGVVTGPDTPHTHRGPFR